MSIIHIIFKNINKSQWGLETQGYRKRRQSTKNKQTVSIYSLVHSGLYCKMINANIEFGAKMKCTYNNKCVRKCLRQKFECRRKRISNEK